MKGVELPINILVIVAIAVIVLLGLVALYFVGFNPFSTAAGIEGIKNDACRELVQKYNCNPSAGLASIPVNMDVDGADNTIDIATDNLSSLCNKYYSRTSITQCKALCGCPGYE
jgi:hypothetical protein